MSYTKSYTNKFLRLFICLGILIFQIIPVLASETVEKVEAGINIGGLSISPALLISLILGLFGANGIGFLLIVRYLDRKMSKAILAEKETQVRKANAEVNKLKIEGVGSEIRLQFDTIEDAAESMDKMFTLFKDAKNELAGVTSQLNKARIELEKSASTIQGKQAIIEYHQQENHSLVERNKMLSERNRILEAGLENLKKEFEIFKQEHESCMNIKKENHSHPHSQDSSSEES